MSHLCHHSHNRHLCLFQSLLYSKLSLPLLLAGTASHRRSTRSVDRSSLGHLERGSGSKTLASISLEHWKICKTVPQIHSVLSISVWKTIRCMVLPAMPVCLFQKPPVNAAIDTWTAPVPMPTVEHDTLAFFQQNHDKKA